VTQFQDILLIIFPSTNHRKLTCRPALHTFPFYTLQPSISRHRFVCVCDYGFQHLVEVALHGTSNTSTKNMN
jgi:hypothetical protein